MCLACLGDCEIEMARTGCVDLASLVHQPFRAYRCIATCPSAPPCPPVQATHIFDGLDNWPTHILFLSQGQAKVFEQVENIAELKSLRLMTWVVR